MLNYLLVSLLVSACSGGTLPISSGELAGTVVPNPTDWREVADVDVVQLETRPASPYSVNLWVIGEPTHLYVFAGGSRSNWVEYIEADSNVRLGINGAIYELKAERVTDADEFAKFADAWKLKYGHRPRNESVEETYLLRLTSR
jgi:hypothetical protein